MIWGNKRQWSRIWQSCVSIPVETKNVLISDRRAATTSRMDHIHCKIIPVRFVLYFKNKTQIWLFWVAFTWRTLLTASILDPKWATCVITNIGSISVELKPNLLVSKERLWSSLIVSWYIFFEGVPFNFLEKKDILYWSSTTNMVHGNLLVSHISKLFKAPTLSDVVPSGHPTFSVVRLKLHLIHKFPDASILMVSEIF